MLKHLSCNSQFHCDELAGRPWIQDKGIKISLHKLFERAKGAGIINEIIGKRKMSDGF